MSGETDELVSRAAQIAAGAPTLADIELARVGLAYLDEDQPLPPDSKRALEQIWKWAKLQAAPPRHAFRHGSTMIHSGSCPACQAEYEAGASWTALPWSETYWSS